MLSWRKMSDTRRHLHELVDRLTPAKFEQVEEFLESQIDPISRALANAPLDDEPLTEEDRQRIAESEEWLKHHEPIPMEEVLAELDLTANDFDEMGKTPLPRAKKD